MLAEHPALLAPLTHNEQEMLALVEQGLGVCEHRSALYAQLPGFPEKLAEYNRAAVRESVAPLPRNTTRPGVYCTSRR
ncbi:MAG: hypothetical protein U9Q70_02545 [Chloroflexota bacterium]|nr:hypothetical protein [Chloroflexota bacterium]